MSTSSSLSSDHDDTNPDIPRKRRKFDQSEPSLSTNTVLTPRWRTPAEQHSYSTKLIDALRHIRRRRDHGSSTGRAVRHAADRVLAASARGKTRWCRAILTRRLAYINNKKHKKAVAAKPARKKKKQLRHHPNLQKKVKVLGRLVPGCRKVSLPNLLEETSDYIKALEMQVKAMAFLTGLLNAGGGDHSSS